MMSHYNHRQTFQKFIRRSDAFRAQDKQADVYAEMIRLDQACSQVMEMLPPPYRGSTGFSRTLDLLMSQVEHQQRHTRKLQALESSGYTAGDVLSSEEYGENRMHSILELELRALDLYEQKKLQQEMIRQLVNQYVDQRLEKMKIEFHFQVA